MPPAPEEAKPGRPGPGVPTDNARQGETSGHMRWVLGVSIVMIVVAMVVAFKFS
jgi:hypothetical protein